MPRKWKMDWTSFSDYSLLSTSSIFHSNKHPITICIYSVYNKDWGLQSINFLCKINIFISVLWVTKYRKNVYYELCYNEVIPHFSPRKYNCPQRLFRLLNVMFKLDEHKTNIHSCADPNTIQIIQHVPYIMHKTQLLLVIQSQPKTLYPVQSSLQFSTSAAYYLWSHLFQNAQTSQHWMTGWSMNWKMSWSHLRHSPGTCLYKLTDTTKNSDITDSPSLHQD